MNRATKDDDLQYGRPSGAAEASVCVPRLSLVGSDDPESSMHRSVTPIPIDLDGSVGQLLLYPLSESQWWALSEDERPGSHYYHPGTNQFFGLSFVPSPPLAERPTVPGRRPGMSRG